MNNVTVVSAYYEIKSKFPTTQYWEWIKNFCEIPFNVVIYTSPNLVDKFLEMRSNYISQTKVIGIELEQLCHYQFIEQYKKHYEIDWNKDHSPELFVVWAEKLKFVLRAINDNIYNTNKFVWCDIGAFRQIKFMKYYKSFPTSTNIVDGRMNFLLINEFEEKDYIPVKGIIGQDYFKKESRLGGGIQGGDIESWKRYEKLWDDTLKEYFDKDKFAGQDQCITGTIYLRNPELFHIIRPKKNCGYGDEWFYLLIYWSL